MQPTNVGNPSYFHKVVDCQWACPAHTNVPEYIRLIAQGRFTEAYVVNRESNVFPGILGRVCAAVKTAQFLLDYSLAVPPTMHRWLVTAARRANAVYGRDGGHRSTVK